MLATELTTEVTVLTSAAVAVCGGMFGILIKFLNVWQRSLKEIADECHRKHEAMEQAHSTRYEEWADAHAVHYKETLTIVRDGIEKKLDLLMARMEK